MPEGYRHLTFDERCRIYATGKGGLSNGAIARRPGRHPATISREIRRNGGGRGYRQGQAWRKATGRRSGASSVPGKLTEERRAKVVAKPGRAGARNRSRGVSGWRTPAWSAVSGYTTSYARTAGRRNAFRAPAAAGKETEPEGWPPRGPGSHPGPEGHPGAPERGRGEGENRRLGSGHGDRRGTRRCGGVACGQMPGIHACPTG